MDANTGMATGGRVGAGGRVTVGGVGFDPVTEQQLAGTVLAALERGEGGRIITPNVDILRLARRDPAVRAHLADATAVVADGMPLVWAARLAGTPLPARVTGSGLIWSLSYHLGRAGRSVYLLGGEPETAGRRSGARRAATVLAAACPGLRIAGATAPPYGFEADSLGYQAVREAVVEAKPDLVYVGLGFPKQEQVIEALRPELPFTWFLGCGAAVNFVAGDIARAPEWVRERGLEWAWRLALEPRRLAGRYLCRDAPYALRLLASATATRLRLRRDGSRATGAGAAGGR